MKRSLGIVAALVCCLAPLALPGQEPKRKSEPLADQVKAALEKGRRFLRNAQNSTTGSWTASGLQGNEQGVSCLVLLALLEAGESLDEEWMQKGLDYVRSIKTKTTYVVSLQTMALAKAGKPADLPRIKENVDWLIKARVRSGEKTTGWGYVMGGGEADGSNTQFALLALWAAKDAGIAIPEAVWRSIRDHYTDTQKPGGHWIYKGTLHADNYMTMTTAGLSGLLIAGAELKEGREQLVKGGPAKGCGEYQDNVPVAAAVGWLAANFQKEIPPPGARGAGASRTFYNLYGIERAGRLSGLRFFGQHDWYREGCDYLVKNQHPDGSWYHASGYDRWPTVSTAFALLFLSKGRTPVLISRAVHGRWPRQEADNDWNRDRNAVKHLTDFCSKHLFKKMPLAWQNFDIMRAVDGRGGIRNEDDLLDITSDLLQAPLLFLNGHQSPLNRFTDSELEVIKKFVENGGFLVAEACCGSKAFDDGFRQLVEQRLFPGSKLEPLPGNHPIWKAHFPVPPGSFQLEGLSMGCKTVLVYAPEDLSCRWEANLPEDQDHQGQLAFRLGANIVAYATGLEPPKPRLTEPQLVRETDVKVPPRGYFKAAQIKHGGRNWQPAQRAIPVLMDAVRQHTGMDVALQPEPIQVFNPDIVAYKFLYLHGRGDPMFGTVTDEELKHLRFNLETGGLLLADACCGDETFDRKFREFVTRLFPKHKLVRVPVTDELFGEKVNGKGERLTAENVRLRTERNGPMRAAEPYLEGIAINDRWVLLYSKYDIGCALARHQSSDCLGYDHTSALRIGRAAVLYLLRP